MSTIEEAKNKIADMPKAKNDLGPLLDALGRECSAFTLEFFVLTQYTEPLFQIISGVCMLLGGVLNLLGSLVSTITS